MASRSVCLVVLVYHGLFGVARGVADVHFHSNAALQRAHDQILESLGLDAAGDSATLVTHAFTPGLAHGVPQEVIGGSYGRYGAGRADGHVTGARSATVQGLPLVPSPVYPFHDVMASPSLVLTPHGDGGVMITPVNNVLFGQHPRFHAAKTGPKTYGGDPLHAPESLSRGRRPGNPRLRAETLLKKLLQRNLQLKQQQQEQQRQHLKQQQLSQRQLQQQQQHHQRQLFQLLTHLVQQKQQAERRGPDPQVIRAIVRQELEQHRRLQEGKVTVNNLHHLLTSTDQARGKPRSLTLPEVMTLWRSVGPAVGLRRHANGSLSFVVSFPPRGHLPHSRRPPSQPGQGSSSVSTGDTAWGEPVPVQGVDPQRAANAVSPPQSLQGQPEQQQQELQQQQRQEMQQQQQQQRLQRQEQKQNHQQQWQEQQQPQKQQQSQLQLVQHDHLSQQAEQGNIEQITLLGQQPERNPQEPRHPQNQTTHTDTPGLLPSLPPSSPSTSFPPPSPSSHTSPSDIPQAEDQAVNEINRPLYQLDNVLPSSARDKPDPIQFLKAQQAVLASLALRSSTTDRNSTGNGK